MDPDLGKFNAETGSGINHSGSTSLVVGVGAAFAFSLLNLSNTLIFWIIKYAKVTEVSH